DLTVDLADVATIGSDGLADHHPNRPTLLEPSPSRPVAAGVMCDRDDELARLRRKQSAADSVTTRLTRGHARALGENHDPVAFRETLPALCDHLCDGRVTGLAVDGDGMQLPDAPSDHRDPQQLPLQHPNLAREDH